MASPFAPASPRLALTPEQSAEALRRIQSDPEFFVHRGLAGPPRWAGQIDILNSVRDNPETLVISGHGLGKTAVFADVAIWFMYAYAPAKVITLAPTGRQVESLLWSEIRKRHDQSRIELPGRMLRTSWEIGAEHFAMGISPDISLSPEDQGVKLQGYHGEHVLVIFDEGMGIDEAFWTAKDALLTGGFCRFLAGANPTAASGPMYESWKKSRAKKIRLSMFDSPNFVASGVKDLDDLKKMLPWSDEKIQRETKVVVPALTTVLWAVGRLRKWGEGSPLFLSRVMATWPEQGVDSLFSLAWLEACTSVDPRKKNMIGPHRKSLGIDVARYGSDNTAFIGINGGAMVYHEVYQGQDTQWTANRAIKLIREDGYDTVVIDTTGLGAGVTDRVQEWVSDSGNPCSVIEFQGGEKPTTKADQERYTNRRAQAFWELREMVQGKEIGLADEGDLFHQLSNMKFRYTKEGRIEIEGKDQMKRRGLASPDEGDAASMAAHGYRISLIEGGAGGEEWQEQFERPVGAEREASRTPWRG